jgi:hypothetical protein
MTEGPRSVQPEHDFSLPSETFADSVEVALFDGETLRLTFSVKRLTDPVPPEATPKAKLHPVCRLILSRSGMRDLITNVQRIAALTQPAKPTQTN